MTRSQVPRCCGDVSPKASQAAREGRLPQMRHVRKRQATDGDARDAVPYTRKFAGRWMQVLTHAGSPLAFTFSRHKPRVLRPLHDLKDRGHSRHMVACSMYSQGQDRGPTAVKVMHVRARRRSYCWCQRRRPMRLPAWTRPTFASFCQW